MRRPTATGTAKTRKSATDHAARRPCKVTQLRQRNGPIADAYGGGRLRSAASRDRKCSMTSEGTTSHASRRQREGGRHSVALQFRWWDGILQWMSLSMMLKLCRAQRDFPDLALTTYTRDGEREQGLLLWPVATVTRAQQLHSILEIQGRKALTSLGGCCSSGGRSLQ